MPGLRVKPALILALVLPGALYLCGFCPYAFAQPPGSAQSATEPDVQAKIAELEAAKKGLERQARETTGYQESLRNLKIVKIDDLIARLKRGEDVPQSKIERTIRHSSLPLYHPPAY
jgi:hypothetical protein